MIDPIQLQRQFWPDVKFYGKQKEIIYSVWENDKTVVPAGNMLGKDFVTGFICLAYFLTHWPCRIITTSVKDDHLRVLWGEINRFRQTSRVPLEVENGGPLIVNHRDIKMVVDGRECPISYLRGCVSKLGEGMAGHHAKHTLFVADEASGIADITFTQAETWAKKVLWIGNPNPCRNLFYKEVKAGDVKSPDGNYYSRVIRIKAEDSPNVQLAQAEIKAGKTPSLTEVVPGVKGWREYCKNRETWDKIRQCVGLDAAFYEGAEVLMYPPDWLNASEAAAERLSNTRRAEAIGCDPAEGGDNCCWTIIDHAGIIDQISMKTPDTSVIPNKTLALMRQYNVEPERIIFDRGGGGKQHADRLREMGFNVQTVGFGESASNNDPRMGMRLLEDRLDQKEFKYAYKNKRAEMYGLLRDAIDPNNPNREHPFAIPSRLSELRQQLAPIPLKWDAEGRMYLPSKSKPAGSTSSEPSLIEIIGHSPDEADSLVMAYYVLVGEAAYVTAGAIV